MVDFQRTELTSAGLDEVCRLLNEVFPQARYLDLPYLDWCYVRNPSGPAIGINAYAGARLVGHLAGLPMRARVEGAVEQGLLYLHIASRGDRGLTVSLLHRLGAAGSKAGYGFYYAVTNARTAAICRRLDSRGRLQVLGPLDARLGIGPLPAAGSRTQAQLAPLWDAASLAWRLARPGARYWERPRGGERVVYAKTKYRGIAAELGRFPAADVPAMLTRRPAPSPLKLWLGLDPGRSWRGRAYFQIPRRLRLSPLVAVFGDLSGHNRRLDGRRVYLDAIDFDAF